MNLERFLTIVEECLGGGTPVGDLAHDEAARTVEAVLGALAPQLSGDERQRLADELPGGIGRELTGRLDLECGDAPRACDPVGSVAAALAIDGDMAARRVACVLCTIRMATSEDAWRALPAELAGG